MKITKCLLVASAAALAGSLLHNVPSRKNDVFKASVLDPNVQQLMLKLKDRQGRTYLNNFASYYFSNLKSNFGLNAYGTCSFVSMGMLLSYYDTYFDDNFIPDAFEENAFIEPTSSGKAIIGKDVDSPGVTSEDYNYIVSLDEVSYEDYIVENPNATFQNFLIMYAADNTDGFTFDGQNIGAPLEVQTETLDLYLSNYVGLDYDVFSYSSRNKNQTQLKNLIKEHIDEGEPVIVNISTSVIGGHSVVAYDYDGNDIYVHTGWRDRNGNALTHVRLDDLNNWFVSGMEIKSIYGIETNGHTMADNQNNYVTVDANGNDVPVSLKTLAIPYDFKMEYDPETPDVLPKFIWGSLFNERWFPANSNIIFQIMIRNGNGDLIKTVQVTNDTSVEIPSDVVDSMFDEFGMFEFSVEIRTILPEAVAGTRVYRQNTVISNKSDYQKITGFDYGFPTSYRTWEAGFVDALTSDHFEFKVRRSRNVIREGSAIKLDVNYKLDTQAFVEYSFYKPITEIKLRVAENSPSNTGLSTLSNYEYSKAALFVQGFKNNTYFPNLDDKSQEERHENNLLVGHETDFINGSAVVTYQFSSPVYRVRIHASANEPERISLNPIGRLTPFFIERDFALYLGEVYVKPVEGEYLAGNGYEFHQGELENGAFVPNDYVYALSLDGDVLGWDYEPGYLTSDAYFDYSYDERSTNLDIIESLVQADAAPHGLTGDGYVFEQIDKNAIPDDGCYKIAIALVEAKDHPNSSWNHEYRFLRQNSDGSWSFVAFSGNPYIRNTDAYGNVIYDPINLSFRENNMIYSIDSPEDIRFYQVSRDKGPINAEEESEYFSLVSQGDDWHHYTWDEHYYIIKPPFKPIFTGEF